MDGNLESGFSKVWTLASRNKKLLPILMMVKLDSQSKIALKPKYA